jgi:DNA-binding PadR family transcriptional regulator
MTSAAATELRSLVSSFVVIWILKHIADRPLDTARLCQLLKSSAWALDSSSLNRTLLRMRRHGWLKTEDSLHSITPAGRRALNLAVFGLKDVLTVTNRET